MIWGEEISEMNLFLPGNPFRIIFFPSARSLKIYFFLGKASQNLFFPQQGLSKFIFQRFDNGFGTLLVTLTQVGFLRVWEVVLMLRGRPLIIWGDQDQKIFLSPLE